MAISTREARRATIAPVFRYFLVDADEQVLDTAGAFVTLVPNYAVGDTFLLAHGEEYRILEGLPQEMLDIGFNGVFVVEPA